MKNEETPSSSQRTSQYKSPLRAPEADRHVDTFLDAVCDTSRRYILELLATQPGEGTRSQPEWRSGDIARALGLAPATTSEHLRKLALHGLVTSRRDAKGVYYQLRNHKIVEAFRDLLTVLDNDYYTRNNSQVT